MKLSLWNVNILEWTPANPPGQMRQTMELRKGVKSDRL